jgi:autotransporter-associated beta strand protein
MSGSGAVIFAQVPPGVTSYVYLSGTNTYSGGTVIQGGYVQTGARTPANSSNSSAFGSGSVTIRDTGTLLVRNNSVVTSGITVSGTGMAGAAVMGSFGTR